MRKSLTNGITMNSITPSDPKCLGSIVVYKKKDFRQQQQRQRAEDDKRLREDFFRDLDYITEEAEREKSEEEDLKEDQEAGKTQFKMNIVKGKEKRLKAETEDLRDVLSKENKEEAKHQKVKVRNNKEADMGETKQIRKK